MKVIFNIKTFSEFLVSSPLNGKWPLKFIRKWTWRLIIHCKSTHPTLFHSTHGMPLAKVEFLVRMSGCGSLVRVDRETSKIRGFRFEEYPYWRGVVFQSEYLIRVKCSIWNCIFNARSNSAKLNYTGKWEDYNNAGVLWTNFILNLNA